MKRVLAIVSVVAIVAAIAWFTSIDRFVGATHAQASATNDPRPKVASIIRGIGYVEPVSEIRRLVFKVDGVIDVCHVSLGQRVEAGTVLVTLKNQDEQAAVAESEQQLALATAQRDQLLAGAHPDEIAAARRNIELLEEQLRYAKKHFERISSLATKKATTAQELDRAETDVHQAEKAMSQAEAELSQLENHVRAEDRQVADAQVRLAESRLEIARQRLANTILKSPLAGTVLEILKREGEGARVTDREPVLIFADDSRLRVRAEIDERYVDQLAPGQTAEVYGHGLGNVRYRGTVAVVKQLMGNKTVFSHEASERKDLDVIQILIDMPADFHAPLGLQVDVDVAADLNRAIRKSDEDR